MTNVDAALNGRKDGKATAFSSLGVAYVIYPAKTITRCAAAGYLRDLIYDRFTRSLTEEDRQQAGKQAQELFDNHASLLNAAEVARILNQQPSQLSRNIPQAKGIEDQVGTHRGRKRLGYYDVMEDAQKTANTLLEQGLALVDNLYQDQMQKGLSKVDDLIRRELNTCTGSDCLYYAQQVFRELKHLVSDAEPPSVGRGIASGSVEEESKKQVQRLESDWIPNRLQQRQMKNNLRNFAEALKNRFNAEVTARAAERAREYRGVVVSKLEDAIARCDRAHRALRLVGDALDDQADEYDPTGDEQYLVATTQLVPAGGIPGAAEELQRKLGPNLAEDARQLLLRLAEDEVLWALSAPDEDSRQTARRTVVERLVEWALGQSLLTDRLQKAVHEVGEESLGAEDFKNRVLANMLRLSDPTWELNLTAAVMNPGDTISIHSLARPDGLNSQLLPTALANQVQGNAAKPLDDRRIMVLQSEHAAPLHAVVGMDVLRGTYQQWVNNPDRAGDPAHLSREWNQGARLVSLFPEVTVSMETARGFALGNFTEWLVRQKKHPKAQALVENWKEHGIIYRRGPVQFHVALLEDAGEGRLRRIGDKRLNEKGTRAVAMENFDAPCQSSVNLYIDRLNQVIAWDEMKVLLYEYTNELQEQIDKATVTPLINQLSGERETIVGYLQSAQGA